MRWRDFVLHSLFLAATTYDITRLFGAVSRINNSLKIVSLLQPPPETVANFDEIILLSEGRVIYSGPVDQVIDHFSSLGYEIPDRMDLADWLQVRRKSVVGASYTISALMVSSCCSFGFI